MGCDVPCLFLFNHVHGQVISSTVHLLKELFKDVERGVWSLPFKVPQCAFSVEATDVVHDAREAPNADAHVPRRLDNKDLFGLRAKLEHHRGVVPL